MSETDKDLLQENLELMRENERLQMELAKVKAKLQAMIHSAYGRKSEKANSDHNQLVLEGFEQDEAVTKASDEEAKAREEAIVESQPRKKVRSKPQVKPGVPVKEERIRLDPDEMVCPECATKKKVIRVEETEELDFVPAHVRRTIYERPICACPKCQEHVSQAKLPPRPIDKSVAGPGLLAHIVVSKYQDHCPLYRQEQIFARHGLPMCQESCPNKINRF